MPVDPFFRELLGDAATSSGDLALPPTNVNGLGKKKPKKFPQSQEQQGGGSSTYAEDKDDDEDYPKFASDDEGTYAWKRQYPIVKK